VTLRYHRVKPPESTPVGHGPASPALPVYALVFTAGMVQSALAPLGPVYERDLHLSSVQVGALFAAASVTMLLAALPIGVVTDRLGARRLTAAAAVVIAVSAVGQALAGDFWLLLASRAVFGIGFGAVWTAGIALLAEVPTAGRRSALGATIPVTGAAVALGPAFAGVVAARFGIAVPFLAIAAAAGVVAVAIARAPEAIEPDRVERPSVGAMLRAVRGHRPVLAAAVLLTAAGCSSSLGFLLVPLRLRSNGVSVGTIGAILGVAALFYVSAGIVAARLGAQVARPAVAGLAVLVLGLAVGLPALSTSTLSLVAFLFIRAGCNAAMTTAAYSLVTDGAGDAGVGAGAAIGLVNAAWAVSTVVMPVAGGAIAGAASDRLAFALLVVPTLAAGVWLIGSVRAPVLLGAARRRP